MNNYNDKEEKKGGFWSALSGIFRGGSSAMGGASSGLGSAGGMGGLFATKAGVLGMVLGGATIAAGVGVVYNFVGPSSKPVYSPELFQNSYYEEESSKAGFERAQARNTAAADAGSLDMFREQAKKDGLGGLASEASDQDKANASANAPADGASADSAAPGGAPGAETGAGSSAGAGGPKLQAGSGFGGKGGGSGSGSSIPRMQGNGGMSGGIGNQFQSVYRAPAQANGGKTSGLSASAARVNSSPKYALPMGKGKGAYGQAKFAGKMGAKAAYSADGSSARSGATSAFSGETTGGGDVGAAGTGAGLGGAGVSNGSALKGNDPSLSGNESTPPAVPDPTDVDPWQATEDGIMNAMMWAGGMILLTKLLSGIAKKITIPWLQAAFYIAAMAAAAAAIFFAIKVIIGGFKMYSTYGQKMMGGVYILAGVVLIMKALEALCSAAGGAGAAGTTTSTVSGVTTTTGTPVLGGASGFLNGMGGMSSMFDLGSLFK